MDLASFQFGSFGLAGAVISNFNRSVTGRCIVLLAASVAFCQFFFPSPANGVCE